MIDIGRQFGVVCYDPLRIGAYLEYVFITGIIARTANTFALDESVFVNQLILVRVS